MLALLADVLIVLDAAHREPVDARAEAIDMSDLINFFGDNASLILEKTLAHLGIAGARDRRSRSSSRCRSASASATATRGSFLAINISNVFRALPSLALIAISLALFGLEPRSTSRSRSSRSPCRRS